MKYIRTKDGIYDSNSIILKKDEKTQKLYVVFKSIFLSGYPKYEEVITSGNTIEELCDEFLYSRFGLKGSISSFAYIKYSLKLGMFSNYTIYGAIWTEWGLKYVAKMNENGELELL